MATKTAAKRSTKRPSTRKPTRSPEEREAEIAAFKAEFDDAVKALMDGSPEEWVEYLATVANFGAQYSFTNQLLLLMQAKRRGMTLTWVQKYGSMSKYTDKETGEFVCKPRDGWVKLGRHAIKGTKALKVWAPVKRRLTEEEAQAEVKKHRRGYDTNGRPITKVVGFRLEPVFDISQTEGEPVELPEPLVQRIRTRISGGDYSAELLHGELDEDSNTAFAALIQVIQGKGYSFNLGDPTDAGADRAANGVTSYSPFKRVIVHHDRSAFQQLKTTIHELAHIELGHLDADFDYREHRGLAEVEAESVAYVVARALDLDTSAYSVPYVAGWSEGKADRVEQVGKRVVSAAKAILRALDPATPEAAAEVAA